jgi:hypothetical protein
VECEAEARPDPDAHVDHSGRLVCVRVVDTGVGIPRDRLASIFDPFVQVQAGRTRPTDGSGLGLTVSRRLARLMGGDLTVRSAPAQGSTFSLWLPAATAEQRDAAEWRRASAPVKQLEGLSEIGAVLTRALPALVDGFVNRVRAERLIPGAQSLRAAQLSDHVSAYIADIASTLAAIEEMRGEPSRLLTDGSDIQLYVADRHGAQRAGLGCTSAALHREWEILSEEMERVVRGAPVSESAIRETLGVLERFLEQGRSASVRALVRARQSGALAQRA